jgi:predicted O-methyltransferase YrrM
MYKNYLLNPRYWLEGIKNPRAAYLHLGALMKHPLLYINSATKVEGRIDHYVGTLLYDCVLSCQAPSINIVELGAFKGLSTVYLSIAATKVGKRVKSFELFTGLPEVNPDLDTRYHVGQFSSEESEFETNVTTYGKREVVDLVIGDARQTMLPSIGDRGFSLAFLDVDVYEVTRELLFQLNSIARGGEIVIVHDTNDLGVRTALDEFHKSYGTKFREKRLYGETVSRLEFLSD